MMTFTVTPEDISALFDGRVRLLLIDAIRYELANTHPRGQSRDPYEDALLRAANLHDPWSTSGTLRRTLEEVGQEILAEARVAAHSEESFAELNEEPDEIGGFLSDLANMEIPHAGSAALSSVKLSAKRLIRLRETGQ